MTDHALRFRTERFTTFVDAVVAIAMTLLILPLMESVSEAADGGLGTGEFFQEHAGQLLSFGLSFVLIANFWMGHHRQYAEVSQITTPLLWLNVAWMATIVWLPVPTAMLGQMDTDPLQVIVYIGTLIATQITTLGARIYLLRHPDLTKTPPSRIRHGAAADIATIVLSAAAMLLAIGLGGVGYLALLLLWLTGPLSSLLDRLWARRGGHRADQPPSIA
ncbi:TMEM175 family protein [Microbacterium sp. NPDC089320]|uniref:TMEM175 family protein n=1 Tax=Microbacterium sp. NPDC089320 TaxID=3155182 RepID=UPI00343CC352